MLQSLMLFLAPAAVTAQAPDHSPPAVAVRAGRRLRARTASLRFGLQVVGNAVGFATLFAGCWFALQLLHAVL